MNLGVVVAATLLALCGAELAVRWVYRDVTTTADNASVFARRWNARQAVNSLGFREREFPRVKPEGIHRIAIVGDSFAYGQGIPVEDRFSNRLEAALNARAGGATFQVLNFGRPGADTDDEIRVLRDTVLPLRPDFVLLQWYVNDMELRDHTRRPRPLPLVPSPRLRRFLNERSALYYVAQNGWASLQRTLGLAGSYEEHLMDRFGDPLGPDAEAADAALHEFFAMCRENGVPVGAVLFPHMGSTLTYPLTALHERVLARCVSDGVPCVDLTETIWKGEGTRALWVNVLDRHPGSEANRLAAETILSNFESVWISSN